MTCQNERSKPFDKGKGTLVSVCGKYLTAIESLDKEGWTIPYCKSCHCFVKVEVSGGKVFLSNVPKSEINFQNRAKSIVRNYTIRGA